MKHKLIIKNVLLIIISLVSITIITFLVMNNILLEQDKTYLKKISSIVESNIEYGNFDSYKQACDNVKDNVRITIIDKNGNVIIESSFNSQEMDKHDNREEIKEILDGAQSSFSIRKSSTANENMIYYAERFYNDNNSDFLILRVATSSAGIFNFLYIVLPILSGIIIVTILLFVTLTITINRNFNKGVDMVMSVLDTVDEDSFVKVMPTFMDDNLNKSINKINDIQDKIKKNIYAIESEKNRLIEIIETLDNPIIILDLENYVKIINKSACEIYRVDSSSIGKHITSINIDSEIFGNINKLNAGQNIESLLLHKNNKYYNVCVKKTRENIILLYTDITEVKEYTIYKDEFFTNASHELKTPVTSIVGFVELYKYSKSDEEKNKYIERIGTHSNRLMRLVLDMLEVSKLDNMKSFDLIEDVNIDNLISDLIKSQEFNMAKREITCELYGKGTLKGNYSSLEELFGNLLSNAIRYNKINGKINISIEQIYSGVRVVFNDTGIGIAKENLNRIFERFYCVDKSRSKNSGGTGLGLAIVNRIVNLYDGIINVESELSKGSTFTIILYDRVKDDKH